MRYRLVRTLHATNRGTQPSYAATNRMMWKQTIIEASDCNGHCNDDEWDVRHTHHSHELHDSHEQHSHNDICSLCETYRQQRAHHWHTHDSHELHSHNDICSLCETYRQVKVTASTTKLLLLFFWLLALCQLTIICQQYSYLHRQQMLDIGYSTTHFLYKNQTEHKLIVYSRQCKVLCRPKLQF